MFIDKKKIASVIVGKINEEAPASEPLDVQPDETQQGLLDCAAEIKAALKSDSNEELVTALRRFLDLHIDMEPTQDDNEPSSH